MDEKRRGLSRRGLMDLLGRSVRGFADSMEGRPETGPETDPEPYPVRERQFRPLEENVEAITDEAGAWVVDLDGRALEPGTSLRVFGVDLPEAIVLVCIHDRHYAACSSECPVDGSDLTWAAADDRLRCPACGSLWRLDGAVMQGPADSDLARYLVDRDAAGVIVVRPV